MSVKFTVDKKAMKELEKMLTKDLQPGKINRHMRAPMNQAGKLVVKKQKDLIKNTDKHIAKSIGQKSKVYKNGVVVRVIGPRAYSKDIKAGKVTKSSALVISEANDIEYGKNDKAAHPFIRPSLPQTATAVKAIISAGYTDAIKKATAGGKV